MYRFVDARFLLSAPTLNQAPAPDRSEVVFVGRSNVGKSSLLNTLTERKELAKSSSTPGKTQLINFFELGAKKEDQERYEMRFVDLPGFGYAKVSKSLKKDWEANLTNFLLQRSSIRLYIQLIDARHPNLENDKSVREYLEHICRPDQKIFTVFTKVDKLKQNDLAKLKRNYSDAFFISNLKRRGHKELTDAIGGYLFL